MKVDRLKKKIVTIEVKTGMNNNDLKNVYKQRIHSSVDVVQVQINLVKTEKK